MANLKDLKSFRQVSWNLLLAIIVINVSGFSFGFDQSVFSTIQAMDGKYIFKFKVPLQPF